ncbi:hypothetical protein EW145_g5613 [Phellinidium pouzarii]|uniref:CSC1/OSCA1-like 7TM region domain-containing protein n=1 Tax=Phellinidium pouzarii TaxID=167371 RepID=A0A4S4L188_9AGAM|nr:hypothetical protein EW145_g5613 [Phellinidium pouzarii]
MSDGVLGDFVDENEASRTLAPAAVGSQVLLMSSISVLKVFDLHGVIFVYVWLPKIVYEPKVKYHVGDKKPPKISPGFFGWLPPLIHTKEPVLLDRVGLDAVAFLRFLRMLRWLFTAIAFLSCAILIPVNVVYNLRHVDSGARDVLSMLTLRDLTGTILFVHVAASYIFTFLVMFFVWINWKKMVELRLAWFRSPEYIQSFYARTLMIQKVPKKYHSDEGIRSILESVQVPYPATSVHIGRRVGRLPELIEFHNDAVRELEQVLVRYLKGGKIAPKRPTLTKGGFLGIGGKKYDAIDFYTNKVKRCEAAIESYRNEIDTRKPENYGFASMAAVPFAHIVARLLQKKEPRGTLVTLAPNPKDIIWENLNKSDGTVASRKMLGWIYLAVVCFCNTIPLLVVSFLANLASLTAYVGFLNSWSQHSHVTFSIISGVLPPSVSALFGWFLPVIMRRLTRFQGAITRSRLDRAVVARYFAFLIISQLFIFTLIGVIINSVKEIVQQIGKHTSFKDIVNNLDKLPDTINTTYIDQANYWLTFFPLRGFLAVFDLAQVLHLVMTWIKTWLFGRTPRDIREWTQPPDFEYAIYYSNILFMCAVAIMFAPLAPLVAVAAAVVFWMNSFVYKYQLMFVYVTKVESGGRLWNVVINRLLLTVVFMQMLMVLTIGLQEGWRTFQWISTLPPILIIFGFKIYLNRKFLSAFTWYVPSDEELSLAKVHSERGDVNGSRLEKRFGHPALHAELFTPMLHASMMPLLPEVYHGRIATESMQVRDLGQKAETSVVPGGIKIAAVQQSELEYDLAMYQRDRGELDWDQRSIASTNMLSDTASLHHQKSQFYSTAPASMTRLPTGYDSYLANGPTSEIEMSRFDSRAVDQLPLLYDQQPYQYRGQTPTPTPPSMSTTSLPPYNFGNYDTAPNMPPHYPPQYPPGVPQYPQQTQSGMYPDREASVHRPSPPSRNESNVNFAGRGAHRA